MLDGSVEVVPQTDIDSYLAPVFPKFDEDGLYCSCSQTFVFEEFERYGIQNADIFVVGCLEGSVVAFCDSFCERYVSFAVIHLHIDTESNKKYGFCKDGFIYS